MGIGMGVLAKLLGNAIKPIGKIIDDVHTSAEEKLVLKARLMEVERQAMSTVLEYEQELVKQQGKIVTAEAQGHSWIQRNWRPMMMFAFGVLILYKMAGEPVLVWVLAWIAPEVPPLPVIDIPGWIGATLATGIGGYVVGRSGEKIVAGAIGAYKKKEHA